MTSALTSRGIFEDTQTQVRRSYEDGGRNQSDETTSQETPRISGNHPSLGKGKKVFFPRAFTGSASLQIP